jgi:hypothetical protein
MQKIMTQATNKKKKNIYFLSLSHYQMHGMNYRLRAIAVANYLASQVVKSDLQGSWPIQSATPT